MNFNLNSVLIPPSIACPSLNPVPDNLGLGKGAYVIPASNVNALLYEKGSEQDLQPELVKTSAEFYLSYLISNCAYRVIMPAYPEKMWATPSQLTSLLTNSISSRIKFSDRNRKIWLSIRKYLSPIVSDLPQPSANTDAQRGHHPYSSGDTVGWHTYMIALASLENS